MFRIFFMYLPMMTGNVMIIDDPSVVITAAIATMVDSRLIPVTPSPTVIILKCVFKHHTTFNTVLYL